MPSAELRVDAAARGSKPLSLTVPALVPPHTRYKVSFCTNHLLDMGFGPKESDAASRATGGSVEAAVQLLAVGAGPQGARAVVDVARWVAVPVRREGR